MTFQRSSKSIVFGIALAASAASFALLSATARAQTAQAIPIYGCMHDDVAPVNSIPVAAGDDLQAAINRANPGDEVVLAAGATFTGSFRLPNKSGSQFITIRGANSPRPCSRVSPATAAGFPRIVASPGSPALTATNGAHNFRIRGIEFAPSPGDFSNGLVLIGVGSESDPSTLPHDIIIDQDYIHGDPRSGAKRGIALNGGQTRVINSYISDIKGVGPDTQAICGWNGPGPYQIVNNYLEAAGENVLFGGQDATIVGTTPSNIVIQYNHFWKPLSWRPGDPSYAGTHYTVKNILEIKNARWVTIDSNLFENNWVDAQNGFAILFTPRNQGGTAPTVQVADIRFSNNVVRHVASAINILGADDVNHSQPTHDIMIYNNLFDDVGGSWGGSGRLVQLNSGYNNGSTGPENVTIDHNTGLQTGAAVLAASYQPSGWYPPKHNFAFRNNLVLDNGIGISGDNSPTGNATFTDYFPSPQFTHNVLVGGNAQAYSNFGNNSFASSLAQTMMTDPTGGALAASSPYHGAAIDGTDIGANMSALAAALSGGAL
jgi:hypothetical protein